MENDRRARIENLFPGDQTVDSIRINDYLDWAAHSNTEQYSRVLAMPPIQRGFVWKPKKIQDLWDSLLRGMPIGSILLKTSQCNDKSRDIDPNKGLTEPNKGHITENSKLGFHLMDGQQRTLAMLLGFQCSIAGQHKLWIDFSEHGKNGSQFQFRITTSAQPFGFNSDGSRLSLDDRRKARIKYDGDGADKTKKEKFTNQKIFNDKTTKPWKAGGNNQEYIFEVKSLWGNAMNPDFILMKGNANIDKAIQSRMDLFDVALKKFQNQWLALIKIPDIEKQDDLTEPEHDYLTMLFERISSGGAPLTPDDLLFSMIKQSWPEAHNIVYDLQNQVGSLMKPTDFVMTAFRLTALQSDSIKGQGDPKLNARTFHAHLNELLDLKDRPLRKMIDSDGTLINAFKNLIATIEYSANTDQSYGIPRAMFPYMNESMLQVILFWMIRNQENSSLIKESKDDIVRFILFWFVCQKNVKSAYEASKEAIKIIANEQGGFPGKRIYDKLTLKDEQGVSLFHSLIIPPQVEISSGKIREPYERSTYFFGKDNSDLYSNFTSRKELLLWFQRKWISKKYPKIVFDPIAGQDEDNVPYDFDHFVPQSNWFSLYSIDYKPLKVNFKLFTDHHYIRRALGNSIGNYRVMDGPENRSRGDMPLSGKTTDSSEMAFLDKSPELWKNYAFEPEYDEIKMWENASPKDGYLSWDDERLLAFQYAVESRVLKLYQRLFFDLEFSVWQKKSQ